MIGELEAAFKIPLGNALVDQVVALLVTGPATSSVASAEQRWAPNQAARSSRGRAREPTNPAKIRLS
jgi:hypothetical protein